MTPAPSDWAIGLTFVLAAIFSVWRDGRDWFRSVRGYFTRKTIL